ncbi:tetratricopeptide repeat protein 29 isoform X4 [Pongo abelii]|uniref:tetratricopeptide repeat protein 29 isoform X4 n=1 Tax=Pongo abelii TaxID=9601 RepID=UPI0023E78098|nr:tetratricopeptide repeat protein 29 isoform X4 [Pongo abelii]XP_054410538.1 tetratricopeptide repeat protein 29 isoform X4 [Pongo abelii]
MTTLPPLPMTCPKLTALARQKLPCSSRKIPRSQLIKEKDDIDHYLEVNFKGLSKEEVAAYRNSYKKNICVDMLRDGYHKSFTELFALMEQWDALKETARVRSLFWLQKPLEEQPDKLDYFYYYLTRAEDAERKSQLLEAAEHYEAFHQLTQGRIWKDETGHSLNLLACESLLRTYRLLSDKMLENKEYKQAIKILIKASEIAKEGSDKKMEAEASYYLGLAHLAAEEYETALTVLDTYCKISTDLDDDLSLGRGYEAVAKVLQSQGETTEAIKYLKKFVKIARNNFQSLDFVRASTMLGDIYNEKGYYNKASECFQQAFDTTVELMSMPLMDETKVHYGIAKAHQMMLTVNNYIESADLTSLNYLLSWKESREEFRGSTVEAVSQNSERLEELSRFPGDQKNEA